MHFFNPAPVMRLVEVVTTVLTEPSAGQAVTELARRLGKTPVQVTDRAGFVANALLLPYLNHAVRLLETGYASRDDIDLAVTAGIGLPMGPLALLDLIGLDTSLSILEVLRPRVRRHQVHPGSAAAPPDRRRPGRAQERRGLLRLLQARPRAATRPFRRQRGPAASLPAPVTLIDRLRDRSAELASLIAAAGINVTRNPAHPSDLVIVAIGPEGGVIGPATRRGPGRGRRSACTWRRRAWPSWSRAR